MFTTAWTCRAALSWDRRPLELAPCHVLWGMHWSRVPTCGIGVFQSQRKPPRHRTFYSVVGTYSNVSLLWSGPPDTSLTLKTCASFLVPAFRIPESFPEVAHPWIFVGRVLYLLEHTLLTKVSSTLAMDLFYWRDGSVWCSAGFQMVQISSDYIQTGGGRANMALAQNCKWILLFIPTNMNCFWSSSTSIFFPILVHHLLRQTQAFHLCSLGFGSHTAMCSSHSLGPCQGVKSHVLSERLQVNVSLLVHFYLPTLGHAPSESTPGFSSAPHSVCCLILVSLLGHLFSFPQSLTLGFNSQKGQLRQIPGVVNGEGSRCGLVGRRVLSVFLHKRMLALKKAWTTSVSYQRGLWLSH